MRQSAKNLRLRQLTARFQHPPEGRVVQFLPRTPAGGWIRAIRTALDMSTTQLGRRLRIAQKNVVALEQREDRGAVTLESLARAARALDCRLVYAIVPRHDLQAIRERRARLVAHRQLGRIAHSMALEDQAVSAEEQSAQEDQLVADLLATWPRSFWDDPPSQSPTT
jgi:predicted DNA-binding mobile mystery protein A